MNYDLIVFVKIMEREHVCARPRRREVRRACVRREWREKLRVRSETESKKIRRDKE